ncbi:hypothetical protein [Saccharopolyspora erythraea]|uniref:hypothetical protein n=1 Tax=Saccharopolyspora erythraea TaxID=1836 RepID=UPI001179CCFB|nr:hypothetical protein [Saccharopolyspora erythraea]QRK90708.1 hypothetical protein JQX30_04215 [Saccharopolyspora erythraea]
MDFGLLVCDPPLLEYYSRLGWRKFTGRLLITQFGENAEFTYSRVMTLPVLGAAPADGAIDLGDSMVKQEFSTLAELLEFRATTAATRSPTRSSAFRPAARSSTIFPTLPHKLTAERPCVPTDHQRLQSRFRQAIEHNREHPKPKARSPKAVSQVRILPEAPIATWADRS